MGNGVIYIIRVPFRLVGALINFLESIGKKFSRSTDYYFDYK